METGEAKFRIKNGEKGPKEKKIYKMMAKARDGKLFPASLESE
jgi:hypothetical protein